NATLGWIDDKVYVVIWTERKGKTRIISARRARKYEEEIFYKSIQDHKRNG
ncbi:MAG: BrnT family toxin, partial [Deltaproteobacteria bacterium]|nr:BrnT family toxin [Deltaproteobacteria bacterium]